MTSTRCGTLDSAAFTSLWNEIIGLLGVRVTQANLLEHKQYMQAMTAHLQGLYPQWPIEEVRVAYQLAVTGEYGEGFEVIVSLTPVQLGKVLRAYRKYKGQLPPGSLTPIQDTGKLLGDGMPTTADIDQAWFDYEVRRAYAQHQQGETYLDRGNGLYDQLDSRGLISFTKERKWDFMKQAQEAVEREVRSGMYMGDWEKRKKAKHMADLIREATEAGKLALPRAEQIRTGAKQLALTTLLNELIGQGVTIDEFLEPITTNQP